MFQVAISDGPLAVTRAMERHARSLRDTYPAAGYRLYEDADVRRFLQGRLGDAVVRCYDRLVPFAYKADLARYCLLYETGGLYADLSHLHRRPIDLAGGPDLVVFRDLPMHPGGTISNGLIHARPRLPVLRRAIGQVLENADLRHYGRSPLAPTGPEMFGRVLANDEAGTRVVQGHARWEAWWKRLPSRNAGIVVEKVMPDGTVVAVKQKRAHGSVAEFLGAAGNDYNRLWRARRIWGEPASLFPATLPGFRPGRAARLEGAAFRIEPGHAGPRVLGPELSLAAGRYRVVLVLEPGASGSASVALDPGGGRPVLPAPRQGGAPDMPVFAVTLTRDLDDLRPVLSSGADFSGRLRRIEIWGPDDA